MHVKYPKACEPGSGAGVIVVPKQLVAPTYRQNRYSVVHRTAQSVCLDPEKIVFQKLLVPILTTTHEQDVELTATDPVTYTN
jgi:hypothetical protein